MTPPFPILSLGSYPNNPKPRGHQIHNFGRDSLPHHKYVLNLSKFIAFI